MNLAPDAMEWWPTVHVRRGRVVGASDEIPDLDAALSWARKHTGKLCLVDLDAIDRNLKDVGTYQELAKRVDLWLDAAPRSVGDTMDLALTGADRLTVRTSHIRHRDLLEAVATCDGVVLGIEATRGTVQERRRRTSWAEARELMHQHGVPAVVIDQGRAGKAEGIDRDTAHLLQYMPTEKWYAGGVRGRVDLEVLQGLKYDGALVGAAWLQRPFDWTT